ncbi:MAG: methyltransferase domain-containing protein [Bryobacteraceae bacterium]|nr:methyltransferase domain-containing protein [Bryobacteraceae bacterium]
MDTHLLDPQFPRANEYHPQWLIANASGGANSLWLAEWLSQALELRPGLRILDLGCGRAASSVFLHREFGVQVWAADLWFSAAENLERIRDAGADDGVYPIQTDARALPFATGFFDAIVSIDSYPYYGTDELYLGYLARFVKPDGVIGIAGSGLMQEFADHVPTHLQPWWEPGLSCLHSAGWWRRHWERSGVLAVDLADSLPGGWQRWLQWLEAVAPHNHLEMDALKADQGRYLGYIRAIGRRRPEVPLPDPLASGAVPANYVSQPLLRSPRQSPGTSA